MQHYKLLLEYPDLQKSTAIIFQTMDVLEDYVMAIQETGIEVIWKIEVIEGKDD